MRFQVPSRAQFEKLAYGDDEDGGYGTAAAVGAGAGLAHPALSELAKREGLHRSLGLEHLKKRQDAAGRLAKDLPRRGALSSVGQYVQDMGKARHEHQLLTGAAGKPHAGHVLWDRWKGSKTHGLGMPLLGAGAAVAGKYLYNNLIAPPSQVPRGY